MSTRRLRQKVPLSENEFDEAPVQNASESEDASEVDFDEDDEEGENVDEEEEIADGNSSEEAYEAEEPAPIRPLRGARPTRETKKRQLTFYEEDDLLDSEGEGEEGVAPTPKRKKVSVKLKIPRRAAAVKKEDDFLEPEAEYKPDVSRMTERQRARLADDEPSERYDELMFARMDEQLLALNRKTQKKKETAEEMAVRKAENARKRADYKIKQLEEEKRETLNKLLKRRANKTRENIDEEAAEAKLTLKPRRPELDHPALIRWVCLAKNSVLGLAE